MGKTKWKLPNKRHEPLHIFIHFFSPLVVPFPCHLRYSVVCPFVTSRRAHSKFPKKPKKVIESSELCDINIKVLTQQRRRVEIVLEFCEWMEQATRARTFENAFSSFADVKQMPWESWRRILANDERQRLLSVVYFDNMFSQVPTFITNVPELISPFPMMQFHRRMQMKYESWWIFNQIDAAGTVGGAKGMHSSSVFTHKLFPEN